MRNNTFQRLVGRDRCMLCLLCLAVILAFVPADAHAKSATEIFDIASKSTVVVLGYDEKGTASSLGSGIVMPDGSVATNCHVIEEATRLVVRHQKREYPTTKLYTDWDRDTCSLTVQGLNAPAVRLGSTRGLKVGTRVYAIGAPQGLELTLSEGIVSSLREITGGQYIQTTAPISPGSSGGGLFDVEGRLLGLTTFYLAKGQNLNFALPVEWISELPKRHTRSAKPATSTVGWLNKALELEAKKDWRGMITHCQRWTAAEPKNASSWVFLGCAYAKSGQTSRAIECFQTARSINPESANAWYNLGIAYYKSGQTSQAIECYQKALSINPESTNAWYNLGIVYGRSRQTSRAITCFQKALSIDPEYANAWYYLGIAYNKSGQNQRVMEVHRRLKGLDPNLAEKFFKGVVLP